MIHSRKLRLFYLSVLFITACFVSLWGQNSSTQQSPANNASAKVTLGSPTPIPFSEVIAQAENASSTLKEIAASASGDPTTDRIEGDLAALTVEINSRLEETARTVEGSTSLDDLRSFAADWRTLTENLPQWRNELTTRARKLEGDMRRLDDQTEKWRKTLDEMRKTPETPPEVFGRIEEIIQTAANIRGQLAAQQGRVVALQNRVAEQQYRVQQALETITQRRESLVGQLLLQDSPPIWSAELWTQTDVRGGLRESLTTQIQGLNAFSVRNRDKLIIHILVFALLAGILFYLRRWARPLVEADPYLKRSAIIFYLPVSTALVLAILFNSQIYPQTPQMLGAIFGAIALLPTVVILRKLIERPLYPLLYSLVVFYFIDQLRTISESVSQVARPLFMTEMLGAFLFFLWFYRARLMQDPPEDMRHGQVFRVIRVATFIVLPIFAAAFLANAFGYVNLGRLLGSGVLRSLYSGVIIYALVRIIDGLIVFALRFRPLILLNMVRENGPMMQERARKVVRFIAFILWLLSALEFFTLREIVFGQARAILTAELNVGSLSISAGDVLLFFVVVWAAFLVSRFVRFVLNEDVFPRLSLGHGIPYAVSTILNYLILLIGFFFAVGAAGFDMTRFTVLIGAFGVGIGFGLQNIFNNFVSGLILLFERPVKVGDEIKIGEATGTIRRIGIRASRMRQWDNSEIIVPNSKLISENVKNWSHSGRKRGVEISVSVAHGADANLVIELLSATARAHPLVVEKPAPQVLLSEIVSPALNFKLRAWTTDYDKTTQIASDLAVAVSKKLSENNIEVPTVAAPIIA